jgi:hypothetical protein
MIEELVTNMRWFVLARLGCILTGLWTAGCAAGPAPIVVYEGRQETVWLHFDPKAGAGHSHPVSLTPEQVAAALKGMRVKNRDVIGGFELLSEQNSSPAFSSREIATLALYLSQALKKASPRDIATFHLSAYDPAHGPLITSGGLFVRNGHLYIILANARTSPSSIQYENTYALDLKDQPLLPIARFKFTVGFLPGDARLPGEATRKTDGYSDYLDDSKLVVIDLARLSNQPPSSAGPSQP